MHVTLQGKISLYGFTIQTPFSSHRMHPFLLMSLPKLCLSLALTWAFLSSSMAAAAATDRSLAVRLQEGSMDCWDSLMELRPCTNEVILFFLNGETCLGPSCCRSIRIIEHQCWPSLLLSLGFTAEEGDILKDYCDKPEILKTPPPQASAVGLTAGAGSVHGTNTAP